MDPLTVAVILRANYGLTRQRRDDRVVGTLIGCVVAAVAASYLPTAALVVVLGLSLGITHAFVRLNYRLASIGASVTALLALHLAAPTEGVPVITRLAYTLVGAALSHAFSYVFPLWEFTQAPRLARGLLGRLAAFADVAMWIDAPDQDYRMARKDLIEALAALSDSAARMGGEPRAVQRGLEEMASVLVAAYDLAANVSATRLMLRQNRGAEGFPALSSDADDARRWLGERLRKPEAVGWAPGGSSKPLHSAALRLIDAERAYASACAA